MAKKRKKHRNAAQLKSNAANRQPSYWMIVVAIFFFFSAGLVVKMVFSPVSGGTPVSAANYQRNSSGSAHLESQVKLVAANFRCACGGCGELFLVDCTCDMERGAKEEKDFIRNKLQQGLTIDQVVDLVDREYGHKII